MASFFPALLGLPQTRQAVIYFGYGYPGWIQEAVRIGDYKAVRIFCQPVEVYDLAVDPYELLDIAALWPDFVNVASEIMNGVRVPPKWVVYLPLYRYCGECELPPP